MGATPRKPGQGRIAPVGPAAGNRIARLALRQVPRIKAWPLQPG
jgi:hypothetical protein